MGQEPDKKKPNFFRRLKDAFNGVSVKDLGNVFKDTIKDLRRPQEIALLAGCTLLPGGWIGYGVYRITKYKMKKADNDNAPEPGKKPEQKPEPKSKKKPPKAPKP
jgi:hypothetical protein